MKRYAALLILMLLVLQSTSSLWIIGSFYLNRDYIAQNICINRFDSIPVCRGQCYLAKELKASEKKQKIPMVIYKEIQLFFEGWGIFELRPPAVLFKKAYPVHQKTDYEILFVFLIDPPPRALKKFL